MLLLRRHRGIGLFVFMLLAVLTLGGVGAFFYSNTSQKSSNERASKETTAEKTTADTTTQSTQQLQSTTLTVPVPEKTATATTIEPAAGWVSAIGDSVMLGAVDALQQEVPNLALLNAQGSRQPSAAIDILRQWRTGGYLGDAVVIDIGNNGPFSSEQFDEMMGVVSQVPKVLIVSLTVPPGVEDPVAASNNAVLTDGVQRYPNTVLVDWQAASANHPEFFSGDSTHLSLQGAQAYAALIASRLGEAEGPGAPPGPQERISWGEGGFFGECVGPRSWCAATTTS